MTALLDLRQLIRIGGNARTVYAFPQKMPLKERIELLSDQLRHDGILSGPQGDRLQYLTLMAEFEYGFGSRQRNAARELDNAIKDLRGRFVQWQSQKRGAFYAGDDPRALRQEIWALMAHAFYYDYCAGRVTIAAKTLKDLKRAVTDKLIPLGNHTQRHHGTRARLCELLAQCLRTERRFDEARDQFLEAIEHTQSRLREKHETPENLASERAFAIISTARLLGGLGRLAILRGQLSDALQMLLSARTILDSVENEALKGVIDSQILIAERRRLEPGTPPWWRQLKKLKDVYEQFDKQRDYDGQRRCCYELGQAYIEQAELLPAAERLEPLHSAATWIARLEGISEENDVVNRNAELYRAHVLRAFCHLLAQDGSHEDAEHSRRAKESVRQAQALKGSCRDDLAGCDCVDIELVKGLVEPEGGDAVRHFQEVGRRAAARDDAELELEAAIRAAQAEFAHLNVDAARKHLLPWQQSSARVENGFLKALFSETAQRIDSQPRFEFPFKDLKTDMKNFEMCYLNWAMAAGKTKKESARLLGIDPSELRRLLEKHGLENAWRASPPGRRRAPMSSRR